MRSAAPARVAEICAGYGGNLRALRQAGFDVDLAWYAEKDADASTVMAHHHPDVPNLGDITTVDWEQASPVDVITAGYPCQSFSHAGKRKGFDDERAVWPFVADAIRCVRPRLVLLENVAGHLARGIDRVLWDLASLGYVGAWLCVRASDLGAPHRRDRVFIAARPVGADPGTVWPRRIRPTAVHSSGVGSGPVELLPTPGARLGDGRGWERIIGRPAPPPTEPGRRGNPRLSALFVEWMMGLPAGYVTSVVGRNQALRLLGNGLVPVQGALAFRSLELSTVPVQAAEGVA